MTGDLRVNEPAALFVVGANHRSAPLATRDRLFFDEAGHVALLGRLKSRGVGQAIALATCDRVEVQGASVDPQGAMRAVLQTLAEGAEMGAAEIEPHVYKLTGAVALRHVFAVAASLDSLVIGEPQVLGQVKASHRLSQAAGMSGPELEAALQAAYAAAKRVRSETRVAERPVSLAAAAAQIARDVHGELASASGLLIGIGDMGVLLAEHLKHAGLGRLVVTASSAARAEPVARQLGCNHATLDRLEELLAASDIVISAHGAGRYTLTAETVKQVLRRRRQRPIFLVDAAIPGDLAPDIDAIDGAFRYDLDALEAVAMAGRAKREEAAKDAWRIIEQEVAAFQRGRQERAAVPALAALRRRFETERERLLAAEPGLDAAEATRLLVNRLLHDPSEALRALAARGDELEREQAEALMRRLFDLEGPERANEEDR
ncbi:MAG: glutamyl-tRNA reductase [Alphaproteobacteria bacterium]|nr:glutamyl-tRNA reductase [Alphaproteobacteria bacterium]